MEWVSRWRHRVNLEWGRGLDRIRLNSIHIIDVDGVPILAKRRRWYAPLLIAVGNGYLRQLAVGTRVLQNDLWFAWETQVYRTAYGRTLAKGEHRWLQIPLWIGPVLSDYLASPANSTSEKLQAMRLAARSLHRLHQLQVCWPDGVRRSFSHGDATVRNVVLTQRPVQATWIDFDMVHDEKQADQWRHADDLRAMLFSAAKWFSTELYGELVEATLTSYGVSSVIDTLTGIVRVSGNRLNSFHLAQTGITYDQNRQFTEALLTAIRVMS